MEVLNEEELKLDGQLLVQTVLSLTELPEPLIHHEMNEVLEFAGHKSESLTIEQLRSAMLSYLEVIHEEMTAAEQGKADNSAESTADCNTGCNGDSQSVRSKSLVILE